MVTTSLPAPSLILRQQFARQIASTAQPLTAFYMGSAAQLIRYSELSERPLGLLGSYNPSPAVVSGLAQSLYAWPNKLIGSTIDPSYVKVHVKNAMLRYHNDTAGTALRVTRNSFRSPTVVYKTNGYGTSTVGSQGVSIGDHVLVTGLDDTDAPFSLASYVIDLKGDAIAATVGSVGAASSNIAATSYAVVNTPGSGNAGVTTATGNGSAYNGVAARLPVETYTVTITVGGAANVAKFSVVSASGTDDVAETAVTSLASAIALGTRGATITFASGTGSTLTVGDKWTVAITQAHALPVVTMSGTYTGTVDRVYIIEAITGGTIVSGNVKVRVTSQDGTDTLQPVSLALASGTTSQAFSVGTGGLTATIQATNGVMKGDRWSVTATAAKQGVLHTIVLAHDFPANVETTTDAALNIQLFVQDDVELPAKSTTPGQYQYVATDTQLSVRAAVTASTPKWVDAGIEVRLPVQTPAGFDSVSQLYVTYRAWAPASTGILTITPNDNIDTFLPGPLHPDNPLKQAVSLGLGAAGGQSVLLFSVGDPSVLANWTAALAAATKIRSCYGHVPLTEDPAVLSAIFTHVQTMNGETTNYYRVLWTGSTYTTGGAVLNASKTSNQAVALATVEDDPNSAGTQYTLVRLSGSNASYLTAGVRAGDELRYNFAVDAFGDVTYDTRIVSQVISATQLLVSVAFSAAESIGKRVEIHRTFTGSDLETHYSNEATSRASDLVRYVLAPRVVIGGYTLPSYFAAAILAGYRSSLPAQQSMSRLTIPGVSAILGLESLDVGNLDRLAANGAMILANDHETGTVIVRHGVTTGETEILAKREESMVSARHANLFAIVDRLKPYVSQINLSTDNLDDLSDLVRAELDSVKRGLQVLNATPELGGQLIDLTVTFVGDTPAMEDTLKIIMQMELGRPGNYIDASVLIS